MYYQTIYEEKFFQDTTTLASLIFFSLKQTIFTDKFFQDTTLASLFFLFFIFLKQSKGVSLTKEIKHKSKKLKPLGDPIGNNKDMNSTNPREKLQPRERFYNSFPTKFPYKLATLPQHQRGFI